MPNINEIESAEKPLADGDKITIPPKNGVSSVACSAAAPDGQSGTGTLKKGETKIGHFKALGDSLTITTENHITFALNKQTKKTL